MLETAEEQSGQTPATDILSSPGLKGGETRRDYGGRKEPIPANVAVKVPVNEDFLFDVDIERRELAPVYWNGPVYEGKQAYYMIPTYIPTCSNDDRVANFVLVRRGSWFFQEGSHLRPCEENLAAQLEEVILV